jgi:hypothetical protein
MYPQTKNIVLGAGRCYFDAFDAAGLPAGERYLADTPEVALTIEQERVVEYGGDGPIAEKIIDEATSVDRSGRFTLCDMSAENLGMFLIGTVASLSTSAGAQAAQPVNGGSGVKQGFWYQLGVSASLPSGVRGIANLVIKDGVPNTYVKDADYREDLETGRIYIIPGGEIAEDTVLTADYDETDAAWDQVSTHDLGPAEGAFRYVANNTKGKNRDLYVPQCRLIPSGELAWRSRTTVMAAAFDLAIVTPDDGRAAMYLNGRPV